MDVVLSVSTWFCVFFDFADAWWALFVVVAILMGLLVVRCACDDCHSLGHLLSAIHGSVRAYM